jgi:hypothetical protein
MPSVEIPTAIHTFISPSLNLNGLAAFTIEFQLPREGVMQPNLKLNRLPRRFPVGTTYVVEGQGGEHGQLLVSSRHLVLPGGQRIEIAADCGSPPSCAVVGVPRRDRVSQSSRSGGRRFGRSSVLTTTPARYRITSGTRISSTQCDTPN